MSKEDSEFRGRKAAANIASAPAFLYAHLRADFAAAWRRLYDGGWRPLLGFMGAYIAHFSYVTAPMAGLDVDYTAVNVFLGLVFLQVLARGAEKAVQAFAERGGPVG